MKVSIVIEKTSIRCTLTFSTFTKLWKRKQSISRLRPGDILNRTKKEQILWTSFLYDLVS